MGVLSVVDGVGVAVVGRVLWEVPQEEGRQGARPVVVGRVVVHHGVVPRGVVHRRVGRLGVVPHTEGRHRWCQPEAVPSRLGRRITVRYMGVHRRCMCPVGRDRKSTRLNSSHSGESRMPSSA